jgi:hypothetical protein
MNLPLRKPLNGAKSCLEAPSLAEVYYHFASLVLKKSFKTATLSSKAPTQTFMSSSAFEVFELSPATFAAKSFRYGVALMAAEKTGLTRKLWCGASVFLYAPRKEDDSSCDPPVLISARRA